MLETQIKLGFERVATISKSLKLKQGDLSTLSTTEKDNLVLAINEVKSNVTTLDGEVTNRIADAISDLINGADSSTDTLKELADKITALVQADNGLVSAVENQSFSASQKTTARNNIGAAKNTDLSSLSSNIGNTDRNFVTDFDNIYNA